MIGQYDDQYVSFRSKEDHAGAVAFMKLVTAAAARPGTIIGEIQIPLIDIKLSAQKT